MHAVNAAVPHFYERQRLYLQPQALEYLVRAKGLQQLAESKRANAADAERRAESKEAEGVQAAKLSQSVAKQLQSVEQAAWGLHKALGQPLAK